MVEKILNNTTLYGKIRASCEGSLHSSTLKKGYQVTRLFLLLRSQLDIITESDDSLHNKKMDNPLILQL